jgi:hypothetical protein
MKTVGAKKQRQKYMRKRGEKRKCNKKDQTEKRGKGNKN